MKRILASIVAGAFPLIALAQVTTPSAGIGGLFDLVNHLIYRAVPMIVALAVVFFAWNVFRYAVAGNEEDTGQAKTRMIWGIIGIFVMVSVWGLVAILQNTFGTAGSQNVNIDDIFKPFTGWK